MSKFVFLGDDRNIAQVGSRQQCNVRFCTVCTVQVWVSGRLVKDGLAQ